MYKFSCPNFAQNMYELLMFHFYFKSPYTRNRDFTIAELCSLALRSDIYMLSWSVEEAHDIISPFSCFVTCFCPTYTHRCEAASFIEILSITEVDHRNICLTQILCQNARLETLNINTITDSMGSVMMEYPRLLYIQKFNEGMCSIILLLTLK